MDVQEEEKKEEEDDDPVRSIPTSSGPLSKAEMQQYCFMLLGIDDAGLLTIALDEIFGERALVSTHAID